MTKKRPSGRFFYARAVEAPDRRSGGSRETGCTTRSLSISTPFPVRGDPEPDEGSNHELAAATPLTDTIATSIPRKSPAQAYSIFFLQSSGRQASCFVSVCVQSWGNQSKCTTSQSNRLWLATRPSSHATHWMVGTPQFSKMTARPDTSTRMTFQMSNQFRIRCLYIASVMFQSTRGLGLSKSVGQLTIKRLLCSSTITCTRFLIFLPNKAIAARVSLHRRSLGVGAVKATRGAIRLLSFSLELIRSRRLISPTTPPPTAVSLLLVSACSRRRPFLRVRGSGSCRNLCLGRS